jgi:hypothetical protein
VAVVEHDVVRRVADRGSGLLRPSGPPPWGRTCWNADLTTFTASSPLSLASSLLILALGRGLGDLVGGGDALVLGGAGTARLRVPGVNSGDVEVAKAKADPCLAPECDRSLSLGKRGSVDETGWGGGGGGGYPRSGGRKPGGGAGGGTEGNAATSPTPVAGLCGCWWRLQNSEVTPGPADKERGMRVHCICLHSGCLRWTQCCTSALSCCSRCRISFSGVCMTMRT